MSGRGTRRRTSPGWVRVWIGAGAVVALAGPVLAGGQIFFPGPPPPQQPLPPNVSTLPPLRVPAENPVTEAKRVLGKVLFWEDQLSSDDTVACGTCHLPETGGADPRLVRTPGADGRLATKDDVFGSPGVPRQLADGSYARSTAQGFAPQVTARVAPTVIGAQFAPEVFADGRAGAELRDPLSGTVVSRDRAALETQALSPPLSSIEMAHEQRDWAQVTTKLARVRPLGLATDLPADVRTVLEREPRPDYPALFAAAFGDGAITPTRIAQALATYQRTLLADQTPFDQFLRGNAAALTQDEQFGLYLFSAFGCANCHTSALLTDHSFRNIGVRPLDQDPGRQSVTGDVADRGKLKVPSLRNVALRPRLMHDGRFETVDQVLHFYGRDPGFAQFTENQDPLMQFTDVPTQYQRFIKDFLVDGLTDPRVAARQFPFDRPTLFAERTPTNPRTVAPGRIGSGGRAPAIIARTPPSTATESFKIGLGDALPGARAWLAWSTSPPVGGELPAAESFGAFDVGAAGDPAAGAVTFFAPGLLGRAAPGERVWLQWRVDDPLAAGGVALSPIVEVTAFEDAADGADLPQGPLPLVTLPPDTLHVARATLLVDWRARRRGHARDRLSVTGVAAVEGGPSPAGARVTLSVGPLRLLDAAPLDAAGHVETRSVGFSTARFSIDPATGRYDLDVSRADLDGILGDAIFDGLEGAQPTTVPFSLAIEGESFSAPPQNGAYVATVRNRTGRTTARVRFSNASALSGAFRVTDSRVRTKGNERRGTQREVLRVRAAVAVPDATPLHLAGPITLELGAGLPLVVPATALTVNATATTARYRVASAAVPGLRRLVLNAASGKLVVEMDAPGEVVSAVGGTPLAIAVTMACRDAAYRSTATLRATR